MPEPHPWRCKDDTVSWGIKENWGSAFLVVLLASAVALAIVRPLALLGWLVMLLALMAHPVTAFMMANVFITPCIRTPPIHLDHDEFFPQHKVLMLPDSLDTMQLEVRNIMNDLNTVPFADKATRLVNNSYIASDKNTTSGSATGWRVFNVKIAGRLTQRAREMMPGTSALLEKLDSVHNAVVSILEPQHCIPIHAGYSKVYVRAHIGMVVPEPELTVLHVNGHKYHWQERELILWDDTFPHEVFHAGKKPRAILYLDVARESPDNPILQGSMRAVLMQLSENPWVKAMAKSDEAQV